MRIAVDPTRVGVQTGAGCILNRHNGCNTKVASPRCCFGCYLVLVISAVASWGARRAAFQLY
jgi:hypothetical protein